MNKNNEVKTWWFQWEGGGYNTVQAATMKEAKVKAKELGNTFGGIPNNGSFTCKREWGERLERLWSTD